MKTNLLFSLTRRYYYETRRSIFHWKNLLTDPKPKFLFLTYHRVLPEARFNPLHTVLPLKIFNQQIDQLAKKYPIISLSEVIKQRETGIAKAEIQIVLTFDDGYWDGYEIIYPILKRKGLPANYFIVTDYIGSNRPFWHSHVIELLYNNNHIRSITIASEVISHRFMQPRSFFIFAVMQRLKSLDYQERQEILDSLEEKINKKLILKYSDDRFMKWEQVKEMSNSGIEIGSHSLTHSSLSRIPFGKAVQEIRMSKDIIEENIKKPCEHFAFPFGSRHDYNQLLINCVKDAGFKTCLLNVHGYNHLEKNNFCFKRIIMEETTNGKHLLG